VAERPELLTRRELEVVRTYLDTGTVKGAAHALGLAQGTVDAHLGRARHRAQVGTTAQLVRELARRGEL